MWYNPKRVILVELITDARQKAYIKQRMDELKQLVETFWWLTVVEVIQQRKLPDYRTYLWKWKLEEVIPMMQEHDAGTLIMGNILKPRQTYNLNEALREHGLQAWDRVDLILKIFERHAESAEARLQIELAAIKHMGPRIFDMGMELGRQGWGKGWWIGGTWSGESNTEIMRRHLSKRKEQIEKKLSTYESSRAQHRQWRKRQNLATAGLVGYTNAWKSSLMRGLTNKDVYIADKLFATLGTTVGKIYYPSMTGKWLQILINDTIGFIRDLPPMLIQAFTSTLEDSVQADVLLHVVDASDPMIEDKIQVVEDILDQIGAEQERYLIFNKVDLLEVDREQARLTFAVIAKKFGYENKWKMTSVATGEGVDEVREWLEEWAV